MPEPRKKMPASSFLPDQADPLTVSRADVSMNQQTILIVENDESMIRYYTCIFEGKYRVMTASTGHHAVQLAKRTDELQLVLLECRLGDMAGLEVLREIKKYRPSVPVMLVTAYGGEHVAVKAFRYGAKDYLRKPVAYHELMRRVAFCLSLKHADKLARKTEYPREERHCPDTTALKDIASARHLNIQKALRYIDDHIATRIDVAALSQKVCMSRSHFSRVFKKAMGTTYQDYVIRRRVEQAKSMLQGTRRTITEIACSIGYSDPNNLMRNFKKLTGLTPTEFRSRRSHS